MICSFMCPGCVPAIISLSSCSSVIKFKPHCSTVRRSQIVFTNRQTTDLQYSLDRLFEIVKNENGRIDVLFASAGFGELSKPLGSITEKGFDDTFNVNVRGTLFTAQKALPLMKDGGSIILNSSIA